MAYDHQSAPWKSIVTSIANQLISVTGLDPSCVRVVASDRYDIYISSMGDRGILIRYFGMEPDTDGGAGRRSRRISRLIRVYLWVRDNLDQVPCPDKWLASL